MKVIDMLSVYIFQLSNFRYIFGKFHSYLKYMNFRIQQQINFLQDTLAKCYNIKTSPELDCNCVTITITQFVMLRLEANGVKRGHAFGDIGDSLGGRAKLRSGWMWGRWCLLKSQSVDGTDNIGLERELDPLPWRITFPKCLRSLFKLSWCSSTRVITSKHLKGRFDKACLYYSM